MPLAEPHLTTPTAYTPAALGQDTEQHHLRVLVDNVATTRGLVLQMAMRAHAFIAAPDAEMQAGIRAEFDGFRNHFHHNLDIVFGNKPIADTDPDHLAFLRASAARDPDRALKMRQIATAADVLARDMAASSPIRFDQARKFFAHHWPVARDQMTQVIWDVWADMDARREADLKSARERASAMGARLTRLERIGKHVRLVSLNASVEAARAGDVGKGLLVIAAEFKTLAEEIQNLAREAQTEIDPTH